jgi:integrase
MNVLDEKFLRALYPSFMADLDVKTRLGRSRNTYLSYVRRFLRFVMERRGEKVPPKSFSREDVDEFHRWLEEAAERRGTLKTVPDGMTVVKGFLTRVVGDDKAEELLPSHIIRKVWEDYEKRRSTITGRTSRPMYTWDEAKKLFNTAKKLDEEDPEKSGYIRTCLVGIAMYVGMRPIEIRHLRLSNFSPDFRTIKYWPAKRGSYVERIIPSAEVSEAIAKRFRWIAEKRRIPLEANPPLFPGKGCRKRLMRGEDPTFMSRNKAWYVMKQTAEAAGVDSAGKPYYGFRRREVTTLLEEGLPDIVVQKLKGWKTNKMVLQYHKTPISEMAQKAAEILGQKA